MGNGSPLPQPSGQFDRYLNDRRILGFTLTKDSQRWYRGWCCLYFDVRLGRATAFGASLTLDEQIRDEAVFVDGMALLSVARTPAPRSTGAPAGRACAATAFATLVPARPAVAPFLTDHREPDLSALLSSKRPPQAGDYQLLFGDLHAHSTEAFSAITTAAARAPARSYSHSLVTSRAWTCFAFPNTTGR
jgi:hypothetical protein